ncbi:argininosuccinate lyase [Haloactinopolyspora alba]|uniref:Argininosuccinate lyase n=1 Tax=Haloactinopolyspora alba TaxID=648780 RepID=A0A2P8DWF0_9ACTN|nr:ATP-grasp domain-containing protein [Haloactinopolyspora alba]PSL01546.1 argininosuccinate lyase [Haloactinopolyspora alba]
MATLLMIESWLHSTGLSLPPLIRESGHRYVLFTRDPSLYPDLPDGSAHPVVRDADEVVVVETNGRPDLAAAATALAARRTVDGVLSTCDYYLEAVAHAASTLGLPGVDAEVVRRAARKDEVRASTARAGLATPAYRTAASWEAARLAAAELGYPLVAKPVDLNSGTSVRLVTDEAALKDAFWEVSGVERNTRGQRLARLLLMEQPLDGPEVSVEAVTRDGETTVIGITAKAVDGARAFVETGHRFPAALAPDTGAAVETHVRAALRAIGYTHGLSHTEVRLTGQGPRIVEINPRQAGGYIFDLVRLVTGTHPLEVLIDLALGRAPTVGTVRAPVAAGADAAAVAFVVSPSAGTVTRVDGTDRLAADPAVHRWETATPVRAGRPVDNNSRLGHVVTTGASGSDAGARAGAAVGSLRLRMDDGTTLAPFGHGG